MTEVYSLHSEQGDEYKLQFTTERSGIIADDILDQPFFFHLIYHRQHLHYAEMIAEGHAKDFGKPEEE